MPRRNTLLDATWPYHVMSRSNNRESFYVPMEQCWNICTRFLKKGATEYGVHIHAFVLMPNHFHLMATTPNSNIGVFMRYVLTEISRGVQRASGRTNHVFGSRYKWSWLPDPAAVAYVYKYILRNPVRAQLAKLVEDYKFSSLRTSPLPIETPEPEIWKNVPPSREGQWMWLNLATPMELEKLVQNALRRYSFAFSRSKTVRLQQKRLENFYLCERSSKSR
ncbi:MAG: transposase [Bdellovibrionales bacterium]|nr:transposase [Bdellovibrionales bacterium]